ncbi:MAG: energy-coupling factor ABC transporter permease [Planctomycetota bacterium]
MHMADALVSPAVGGVMGGATVAAIAYCSRKLREQPDERRVPLMGVIGAFVFAAQMINFCIPGTGSSGHLGGGLLLAVVLGPHAAFLVMTSILAVQALFFADGGLLALGCNIFNLAFFPCFLAYPLVYRPIVRGRVTGERVSGGRVCGGRVVQAAGGQDSAPPDATLEERTPRQRVLARRVLAGSLFAAIPGLQLGAFAVVLETRLSGITDLPFGTFLLLMQPIHLAIGIVEGLATAAVVLFVAQARPEILAPEVPAVAPGVLPSAKRSLRAVLAGLLAMTVVAAGAVSWFASTQPDGLEWSLARVTGAAEARPPDGGAHAVLARLQETTSFLPGYALTPAAGPAVSSPQADEAWPAVDGGTSLAGLIGSAITLGVALLIGFLLGHRQRAGA